jgi:hypothetical protein
MILWQIGKKALSPSGGRFFSFFEKNKPFFQAFNPNLMIGVLEKKRKINYHSARLPVCALQSLPDSPGYPPLLVAE